MNPQPSAPVSVSTHGNPLNCHVAKTYHGPTFTPIGKPTKCHHFESRIIVGYDTTPRGRIDAEVCINCDEVLDQKIIR